jgi:urease accessory protein UreF
VHYESQSKDHQKYYQICIENNIRIKCDLLQYHKHLQGKLNTPVTAAVRLMKLSHDQQNELSRLHQNVIEVCNQHMHRVLA